MTQSVNSYDIALIPGDGIGKEVVPEALRVLKELASRFSFGVTFKEFPYSSDYYLEHGKMMPGDGLEQLKSFDAIILGAVGDPRIPDHVTLWELLMPLRRGFDLYVNLRPVKLLPGLKSALAGKSPDDIDFIVLRENTEGEYSDIGGIMFKGFEREMVIQESVFTKKGVDRIQRYAFELAMGRAKKHVTSATKSNGIKLTMPYWDERFKANGSMYPEVKTDQFHIDILCAHFVQHPEWFDVVVASNLFGDILSDLGPATAGGIGIAPSANLNPEKIYPSVFEPVHGSAPDIAGKGIANPIAAIWSVKLMLDFLGESEAGDALLTAMGKTTAAGNLTPDLGGSASTSQVTDAVITNL
jgi:tartrate dehydrogenase/decarboxylase/D-malate dehydrogenase